MCGVYLVEDDVEVATNFSNKTIVPLLILLLVVSTRITR
jgi:hypothetical protein